MSELQKDKRVSSRSFRLKTEFSEYRPTGLMHIAERLEKAYQGLTVKSSARDIEVLIAEFTRDMDDLSVDDLQRKWMMKRRALLDILIVTGRKTARDSFSSDHLSLILENASLILLSSRKVQPRYIEALGFASLNNMGNEVLWRLFTGAMAKPDQKLGRRATVWSRNVEALRTPERFINQCLEENSPVESLQKELEAEGTWAGTRLLRDYLYELAKPGVIELYENELFGEFDLEKKHPENMGFLAKQDIEVLSAFINSYCSNLRSLPEKNRILEYLTSRQVMDVPSAGVKWLHPLIHDQARDKVERYLLGVDFRKAFDHILEHQARKRYWTKWLEGGHVKRIRVFGSLAKIKRQNFNCSVGSMQFPTLQMDLGPCYVFECGQHGSGALYVYPAENGPVSWDHKYRSVNQYKGHILHPKGRIPRNWLKISHSGNWQLKFDNALAQKYALVR